jgi:hypothetical protein
MNKKIFMIVFFLSTSQWCGSEKEAILYDADNKTDTGNEITPSDIFSSDTANDAFSETAPDQTMQMDSKKETETAVKDMDGDNVPDDNDNCPLVANPDQADMDSDSIGDLCDDDMDGDNILNDSDNCPSDKNPGQDDNDKDKTGDVCDPDDDNDQVPDEYDIAPLNPYEPGTAKQGLIYAHTSDSLYSFDPKSLKLESVGDFIWPSDDGGHMMTDIAIDRYGILYGITFDRLYHCNAITLQCTMLAVLGKEFNGMTMIPKGILDPLKEVMIGIGNDGSWNKIQVSGTQAMITQIGYYGSSYSSSGDAYSLEGIGTFASVKSFNAEAGDLLVRVDPATGKVISEIGVVQGYTALYGLAGWGMAAFGFDASGAVIQIDVKTGNAKEIINAWDGKSWWGAGVTTRYDQ